MDTLCLQDDSSPVPVFNLQNQHASQGHTPIHTQRDFSDPTLTAVPAWDGSVTPKHEVPPPPQKKSRSILSELKPLVCVLLRSRYREFQKMKSGHTQEQEEGGGEVAFPDKNACHIIVAPSGEFFSFLRTFECSVENFTRQQPLWDPARDWITCDFSSA